MNDRTTTTELPPPAPTVRPLARAEPLSSRQGSRRASYAKWVLLVIALIAAAAAAGHWYLTKDEAGTDDANTDGLVLIRPRLERGIDDPHGSLL